MTAAERDRTFRAPAAVLPDGVAPADVVVRDGVIAEVLPLGAATGGEIVACQGVLMPGLVDTHVHVNEPGRTEWEGFATATRAAAAGGITTLVDMPLNSIPATTTVAALEAKRAAAQAAGLTVDVGFWGGVVPGNAAELEPLAAAGVLGFKCFLVPSGVDEFAHVTKPDLVEAMPVLARLGLPLLVHAELPEPIAAAAPGASAEHRSHATWLASRPAVAEVEAILMVLRLSDATDCAVHIVHLSASEALADLRAARDQHVSVTVETCPHYLTFVAEEIADGATAFKCAPPIRARANRERLWEGLGEGDIDLIATDHSPCPPAMKGLDRGDFFAAWGGIASLEVALAAVWTEARGRGFTPEDLAQWMAFAPARLAGLAGRKGVIARGADADLVVWNPDAEWTVDAAKLQHRHPVTPYHGRTVAGAVRATYLRGVQVFDGAAEDGARFPGPPAGRTVDRAHVSR